MWRTYALLEFKSHAPVGKIRKLWTETKMAHRYDYDIRKMFNVILRMPILI